MSHRIRLISKIARFLPLLLATGCLSLGDGDQRPNRFFTLYPLATQALPGCSVQPGQPLLPGIGPVRLAGYLSRSQLVTRRSDQELQVNEFSLWAEPLEEGFARTLAANLSALCAGCDTVVFPWPEQTKVSHQIRLNILRFDSGPDQLARLWVDWTVQAGQGGAILIRRQSRLSAPVTNNDDSAIVAALSDLTADFSREVAQALVELNAK